MTLSNHHVLVLGLGESGLAMARWCARQGARLTVADSRAAPPNVDQLRSSVPEAHLVSGAFALSLLDGVDLVALSPGVPLSSDLAQVALTRGIPVWSEIELFARALRECSPAAKVLAITGSNGKTTTTALTAHLINAAGKRCVAAGNISPSALDALMDSLDRNVLPEIWVLELSSFQLETTMSLNALGATVLNVSEDHLDRYAGMDEYATAKARVFQGTGTMVLNRDDARVMAMAQSGRWTVTFGLDPAPGSEDFGWAEGWLMAGGERLVEAASLPIKGLHNVANALAALALCRVAGLSLAEVLPALTTYRGLPHRVEWVAAEAGVDYFDDSKATNVGATLAALQGLGRKVAIILGGEGKGQDFTPLGPALAQHGRAVALIGRDAQAISDAVAASGIAQRFCADMDDAVSFCRASAKPGDVVMLSPACASFDMYRNYVHRAEVFTAAVRSQIGGGR